MTDEVEILAPFVMPNVFGTGSRPELRALMLPWAKFYSAAQWRGLQWHDLCHTSDRGYGEFLATQIPPFRLVSISCPAPGLWLAFSRDDKLYRITCLSLLSASMPWCLSCFLTVPPKAGLEPRVVFAATPQIKTMVKICRNRKICDVRLTICD